MAVLVMLNNYMHDLATAIVAVSGLAAYYLYRTPAAKEARLALAPVVDGLVKTGMGALAWVLLGGVFRALAYRQYEWMEAAGKNQIPALILKHVVLVTLVGLGVIMLFKVRRLARAGGKEETGR